MVNVIVSLQPNSISRWLKIEYLFRLYKKQRRCGYVCWNTELQIVWNDISVFSTGKPIYCEWDLHQISASRLSCRFIPEAETRRPHSSSEWTESGRSRLSDVRRCEASCSSLNISSGTPQLSVVHHTVSPKQTVSFLVLLLPCSGRDLIQMSGERPRLLVARSHNATKETAQNLLHKL